MAELKIGGRSFEIAPYKLGALRQAAPHIDAINASVKSLKAVEPSDDEAPSIVGLFENTEHLMAILAIGLQKIDPACTAEWLDEVVGPEDMPAIGVAFRKILAESGLVPPGEAKALAESAEASGA